LKSRILAGTTIAALALAALVLPATPAFAAGTGTLVVDLVTPAGLPIDTAGLAIYTYDTVGSSVFFAQESESNASGVITVTGVPAGKINTEAPPQNGYAPVEKNGLTISARKTLTIKLVLARGGIIKGLVTNGLTSTALEGANVEVLDSSGNEVAYVTAAIRSTACRPANIASSSTRKRSPCRVTLPRRSPGVTGGAHAKRVRRPGPAQRLCP